METSIAVNKLASFLVAVLQVVVSEASIRHTVKLNHIQVLHAHNSYHQCPGPVMRALFQNQIARPLASAFGTTELQYTMPPMDELVTQYGVRSFEIDVAYDEVGGTFYNRAGPKLARFLGVPNATTEMFGPESLRTPGWKVVHIPDIDFRSTCNTLVECLQPLQRWRQAHPQHDPLFIHLEPKTVNITATAVEQNLTSIINLVNGVLRSSPDGSQSLASTVPPNKEQVLQLERDVLQVFNRSDIFTPDAMRGRYSSIRQRIRQQGFPNLSSLQGKVLLVLIDSEPFTTLYEELYPNTRGALFFREGSPNNRDNHTLFTSMVGNANPNQAGLLAGRCKAVVEAGYLLRVAADSGTYAARANDTRVRDVVLACGAHFVHTDYPNGYTSKCDFPSNYTVPLLRVPRGGDSSSGGIAAGGGTAASGGLLRMSSVCNPTTSPRECRAPATKTGKLLSSCICQKSL
mmetsp:Transcript_16340/g.35329  ORF Transcript_16340/g.35329 Transcript_16340/m.35329 type:complete len:460 (+) Transcript_16340:1553-2932(+)|eukprot:CAMPEP_0202890962 /NCGR_PEP_ID=MMETSP1392-20130828/1189_1 /ASSEMBLY_ACC=CAM_ASM_000868 /TAXON_ID=225041 /ORGANISM="Chlamydomonas chlamydogama, Strain SAG 11-48b" /LENGTH=459 /DNA_ID=CAMNT_0049574619 /DNA_START=1553 /DNA_END=2932 /DNA_ORIENTATION=+